MTNKNANMPQKDDPHTENAGEETGILRDPGKPAQGGPQEKTDFVDVPGEELSEGLPTETLGTESLESVESMPTQEMPDEAIPQSGLLSAGLSLENPMEKVTDALSSSGLPTEEVPGEELTESAPAFSTAQIPAGEAPTSFLDESADTEEVYVILPEGEEDAIPIVETQVVGEGEEAEGITDAMVDDQVGTEQFELLETGGEMEDPGSEHLHQLAEDLDDELLAPQGELPEDDMVAGLDSLEGEEGLDYAALTEEADWAEEAGPPRRGSRRKVLLGVAALLLIAAGAVYYFQFYLQDQSLEGAPVAHASSSGVGSGSSPGTPTGQDPDGVDPVDPVELTRGVFHEKYLLAIELGFASEAGNE